MVNRHHSRDPITDAPLHDPGQSLRERLLDQVIDRIVFWVLIALAAFTLAISEWFHWLTNMSYRPIPTTLIAVALGGFAAWRWGKVKAELTQWKLGLKGERAVGQFLQGALLPLGYYLVHDVCGDNFNIDQVVIGPGGVFAVEVKTRTKSKDRKGTITYDGQVVLVDGFAPDRDPISQASAAARSLQKILEERTGHRIPVRPVVLFPGWWVDPQPKDVETWVLNPKGFVSFVENENAKLTQQQCRVLFEGLARHVRDQTM